MPDQPPSRSAYALRSWTGERTIGGWGWVGSREGELTIAHRDGEALCDVITYYDSKRPVTEASLVQDLLVRAFASYRPLAFPISIHLERREVTVRADGRDVAGVLIDGTDRGAALLFSDGDVRVVAYASDARSLELDLVSIDPAGLGTGRSPT